MLQREHSLQKFQDVEYVELLLNPVDKCIAIRPTDKQNPNAIHWGKVKNDRWAVLPVSCTGLLQVLGDIMDWDDPDALSFVGEYVEEQKLLLFGLENSAITCAVVPDRPEEGDKDDSDHADVTPQKVVLYSHETGATLDIPITTMAEVSLLERKHYAGDWDVLRPATKLEEKEPLTQDRLAELMSEAEEIIERWAKNHDEQ